MEELKPCPFCGGKLKVYEFTIGSSHGYDFSHVNSALAKRLKCPLMMPHYSSEEDAVAALNTRAERTCRFIRSYSVDRYGEEYSRELLKALQTPAEEGTFSTMEIPDCWECTNCGWQVSDEPPEWMLHCAHCGAKVERGA